MAYLIKQTTYYMKTHLRQGHRWLPGQEERSQVRLHLVLWLSILLYLSSQAIVLLYTFCISGVVHLQHIIPVFKPGLEDLVRKRDIGKLFILLTFQPIVTSDG